jgi:hypothetical protein
MAAWGGIGPRRPDQRIPATSRAGSGPAPSSAFVVARRVVVIGPADGLFVYNGSPAHGNLIVSIAPGPGTDLYGNKYPAGVGIMTGPTGADLLSLITGDPAETAYGQAYAAITGTGGTRQAILQAQSATLGHALAELQLLSGSADGTVAASSFLTGALLLQPGSLRLAQHPGVESAILSPTGDTTGAGDWTMLNSELNSGSVIMLPGAWYLVQPLEWEGTELAGLGYGTTVQPGSSWATAAGAGLLMPGSGAGVRNMYGNGGSGTRSANPASDLVQLQPGTQWWYVENVRCDTMNGKILGLTPATASHGSIQGIKGEHNAKGVAIDNGTGGSVTAEITLRNLDIQNCEVGEVLLCAAATDISGGDINGSVEGGVASNVISINGSCQTIQLDNLDVGGGAGTGVVVLAKAGGASSPSDIRLSGKAQGGAVGVVVSDACSRIALDMLAARNQGDGFLFSGTGNGIQVRPAAHLNNQGGGGGYDVDVTSTAHVLLEGPAYDVGGPVTANLNITLAGNHVTEANPPAGRTAAGFAPAGW